MNSASDRSHSASPVAPRTQLLKICLPIITLVVVIGAALQAAQAQSTRTYVSRTGKDGNTCTEASPCRTLQAALAKTQAGGQIYTLGSADYGYVTINKAVSIISGRGATGVLATSNVTGITINAGASDIINLQGLNIDGAGVGSNGILFTSGAALSVKDSVVRGFSTAINFQPSGASTLSVTGTLLTNNATGVSFLSATTSTGTLADVQLINGSIGLVAQGASSSGQAVVTLQNCVVANNTTVGIRAASYSAVTAGNCTIANNGIGLEAQSATGLLQVSGSTVTGNGIGWQVSNGGQVISASNNSIGGNTSGNAAPPTSTVPSPPEPPPPPPEPTFVAKNIVTDFGAKCDGSTDDATAFAAFNNWAKSQALQVQLTIPSGHVCALLSTTATWWAKGIKDLLVIGYGATITNNNQPSIHFHLGGLGTFDDGLHHARVATVSAGAGCVSLLTQNQATMFSPGTYALMGGFDLQGLWQAQYGFPANLHYFEYVKINSIDVAAGVICFESPLKNEYKSTWPTYNNYPSGAAALHVLDPSWDTTVEYRGLTISQLYQTYSSGRSITYRDVTFTGNHCGIPTQNLIWQAINTSMTNCYMEVDKLVGTMILDGVTIGSVLFQSSSVDLLQMSNTTVTSTLNGTPKRSIIRDTTITNFIPGALGYGRTDEIICTNCRLTNINAKGVLEKGPNDAGVNNGYTMKDGIIIVPNKLGALRWAVPGTNLMWTGAYESQRAFKVIDVTQDEQNTYVHTSWSGGFPTPGETATKLYIRVHPVPRITCRNCSGSLDALDLSQAPEGWPIYSYSKRTYTGADLRPYPNTPPAFRAWGSVISVKFNVEKSYTGVLQTLTLMALDQPTLTSSGSEFRYRPIIDLRTSGERIASPSGTSYLASSDKNLSLPEAVWFVGHQFIGPNASADVAGEPSNTWPTVTVEIMTDQGLDTSQ